MLLQEGAKQWVRASSLRSLFAPSATIKNLQLTPVGQEGATPSQAAQSSPPTAPLPLPPISLPIHTPRRGSAWLFAGIACGAFSVVLCARLLVSIVYFGNGNTSENQLVDLGQKGPAKQDDQPVKKITDTPKKDDARPKKDDTPPKKGDDPPKDDEKKNPPVEKLPPSDSATAAERFIERINLQRRSAGWEPWRSTRN